jgi:hypothetical protein
MREPVVSWNVGRVRCRSNQDTSVTIRTVSLVPFDVAVAIDRIPSRTGSGPRPGKPMCTKRGPVARLPTSSAKRIRVACRRPKRSCLNSGYRCRTRSSASRQRESSAFVKAAPE